jgi:hypothetical protein
MATKTKTEVIKTSVGAFECEVIELTELNPVDKKRFGTRLTEKDYNRVINSNVVIYLNGQRAGVFLKKAIKSILDIKPGSDSFNYWKWASKDLFSSQRGVVTGIEFTTELGRRYSRGQIEFFKQATKGKIKTIEEAHAVIDADTRPSNEFFYLNILEKTPYIDSEVIEPLQSKLRKKSTLPEEKKALQEQLDAERLKWFERWLEDWEQGENKVIFAKEAHKLYTSTQKYANNVYSNVLGVLDRSARLPYGRLTASTAKRYDDFVAQGHIYKEISDLYRCTMEDEWNYIHNVMKECKSPEYTLMGTQTFSTITVNYNWPTMLHTDGANNDRGVAVLTAITNEAYDGEKFDGSLFIVPPLGLAFRLKHGDFLICDNCNLAHGQDEQIDKVPDVDNIVCVYYARAAMTKLDPLECETCRHNFIKHAKIHLAGKYRKTEGGKFSGVFPNMWTSPEWDEYRAKHCPDATRTNYHYTEV